MVGLESAEPEWTHAGAARRWPGNVYRLRVVGSIAITAAYVAAGRFDAMLSLRPCRSVDAAAAQLIVREAGGAVAFGELALEEAPLDLDARYPIAAAAARPPWPPSRRPARLSPFQGSAVTACEKGLRTCVR